jgi:hypothetical protein
MCRQSARLMDYAWMNVEAHALLRWLGDTPDAGGECRDLFADCGISYVIQGYDLKLVQDRLKFTQELLAVKILFIPAVVLGFVILLHSHLITLYVFCSLIQLSSAFTKTGWMKIFFTSALPLPKC